MLTSMLLLIHLFFHDYSSSRKHMQECVLTLQTFSCVLSGGCRITGTVALNAAIFASVLLASRLPSTLHVFAIVALATQLFAMSPLLRNSLKVRLA
jgi:phosphatidylinositol glycan class C protein